MEVNKMSISLIEGLSRAATFFCRLSPPIGQMFFWFGVMVSLMIFVSTDGLGPIMLDWSVSIEPIISVGEATAVSCESLDFHVKFMVQGYGVIYFMR
jgi:hypothetical protein